MKRQAITITETFILPNQFIDAGAPHGNNCYMIIMSRQISETYLCKIEYVKDSEDLDDIKQIDQVTDKFEHCCSINIDCSTQ